MGWDFETDPEFQKELDWVESFIKTEVAPLDHILGSPYDVKDANRNRLVRPLQQRVKARKLSVILITESYVAFSLAIDTQNRW
jgi:acyl-CoA dehydrogenase